MTVFINAAWRKKMNVFDNFRGFWGTAAEMSERAKTLGKAVGVKPEKLTMRLIRYYAAQGVLDKPNRLGREAAFHFRHMLQLLVARRLLDEGLPLEVISKFNVDASMEELELALLKPEKYRSTFITEKYRKEIISSKNTPNNSKQQLLDEELVSDLKEWKKNIQEERIQLQKTVMSFEILLESFTKEQIYLLEKIKYDQEEKMDKQLRYLEEKEQIYLEKIKYDQEEKVDSQLRYLQNISKELTQSKYDKEKQTAYMEHLLKQVEIQFDVQQKQIYVQQKLYDEQHFIMLTIKDILNELGDDKSIITKIISKFKKNY
jgi:DNA-binding transcriptional MerR regulator